MESYKICPKCQTRLGVDVGFCTSCGNDVRNVAVQNDEPAANLCPNCGQPLPPGSKFCTACGTVLGAAAAAGGVAGAAAQAQGGAGAGYQAQGAAPQFAQNAYPGNQGQAYGGQGGQGAAYGNGAGPQGGMGAGYQAQGAAPQFAQNTYPGNQGGQPQGGYYQQPYGGAPVGPNYYDQPEVSFKDKFLSFKGRLNRKPYIMRGIALSILSMIGQGMSDTNSTVLELIALIFILVGTIGELSIGIRRCHDMGHSGWWIIIPFYSIYILFAKGTDGPNEYGPDPLAAGMMNNR